MSKRAIDYRSWDYLAEAHEASVKAVEALDNIDLRRTTGKLRDEIREARTSAADLREHVHMALLADAEQARNKAQA